MIRAGTRLYAVSEIKDILNSEIDQDFIMYMKALPDNIQNTLISWIIDDKKREAIQKELNSRIIKTFSKTVTKVLIDIEEGILNEREEKSLETASVKVKMTKEIKEARELYDGLTFKARMDIPVLLFIISDSQECPVHQSSLEKLQVLLPSFGGTKKYSIMVDCCKKCKRFYMTREQFLNIEPILKEKFVKYIVEN